MDGPSPSNSNRCSWCGALNSASEHACAKCGAVLASIQRSVDARALDVDSPLRDEAARAPSYQEVNASAFDSSLLDMQTSEAIRSLGLGPSFESNQILAFLVAGGLSLYILIRLFSMVVDISRNALIPTERVTVQHTQLSAADVLLFVVSLAVIGVFLATAVLFLAWVYRAHKNLKALGATDLKYSPGWAIGGFFVPFLNLVRPYQVVTEIWNASASQRRSPLGGAWKQEESSWFIGLWWSAWLLAGVFDSLGVFMVIGSNQSDQLSVATRFLVVSDVVNAASAALAIMVVLKINARQEKSNRLNASQQGEDVGDFNSRLLR